MFEQQGLEDQPAGGRKTLLRILAWIGSLILLLGCFYMVLGTVRSFLAWGGAHWSVNAHDYQMTREFIERLLIFFMALAVIALSVVFEYRYRRGMERGRLGRAVARVMGIELAVIVVGFALQLLFSSL